MKRYRPRFTLVLSIFVLIFIGIYYLFGSHIQNYIEHLKEAKKVEPIPATIIITDSGLPPVTSISDNYKPPAPANIIDTIKDKITLKSKVLPVKNILQLPELPTGCEITSLTIMLNYLGYKVDKEDLARNYLNKAEPYKGSFHDYFIGSPWNQYSWGCYAPVIIKSAKQYLSENGSKHRAYNITGSSMEELLVQLELGNPIIVWTSRNINKPPTKITVHLQDGTTDYWYSNEHVVVLIGYDLQKGTVTVCDPLVGVVERNFNTFSARYEDFQRMAIVIQ